MLALDRIVQRDIGLPSPDCSGGEWPGMTLMKGPRVPCLPSVMLAQKLLVTKDNTDIALPFGAGACIDVVSYKELSAMFDSLGIETSVTVK